jgi:hypothetical protein
LERMAFSQTADSLMDSDDWPIDCTAK